MDHYAETAANWNSLAGVYEERFMHLNIYDQTYDAFCNVITGEPPRILETGCGPGMIAKYMLTRHPQYIWEGTDVAPEMIELARKNNPSGNFHVMDCRDISSISTIYNGIISGFCFPYLAEPDVLLFIDNASKLLSKNGVIYLSFMEGTPQQSGYQTGSTGIKMYFYYHNLQHITVQLTLNGFATPVVHRIPFTKADGSTETHTVVIAVKK